MIDRRYILITGGCGYVGSHTIISLLNSNTNYSVVIVDDLSNSSSVSLDRIALVCGLDDESRKKRLVLHRINLCNQRDLRMVFNCSPSFEACIHFAGYKAVGESSQNPLKYYENNILSTFNLLRLMQEFGCHTLVFSSSATVYGSSGVMPIREDTSAGIGITSPYGKTKYMIEELLNDFYISTTHSSKGLINHWSITILRYFNPVGAHPSGNIGEDPNGIPNNLMPYLSQVAVGYRDLLTVFGNDYDTHDGTGIRDYLHVMDLADGHMRAIEFMLYKGRGYFIFNLGTGKGYSVLDVIKTMERTCGNSIHYSIGARRTGDIANIYSDVSLAEKELGWKAIRGLNDMCRDMWCWQKKNPQGYPK